MRCDQPHRWPVCYSSGMSSAVPRRDPAVRVSLLPRDTNPHGTIFGGIILSYIDQAGAIEAFRHGAQRVVTVAMDKVVFHAPVYVGDLVSFYGELIRVGTTSITVKVVVEAELPTRVQPERRVTEAVITYVNVDERGRPRPIPRATGSGS
jgi:acyl-CoA thioesterase YciA